MRRADQRFVDRQLVRPPLALLPMQERHLHQMAETLPVEYRANFHAVVRSKLIGAPLDAQVREVAQRVARAIATGAKLAAKQLEKKEQ